MREPTVCTCASCLVDYVAGTVDHPYLACPFYGQTTELTAAAPAKEDNDG